MYARLRLGACIKMNSGTSILPEGHLRDDSKDTAKMGAGMIATLSALVLGHDGHAVA